MVYDYVYGLVYVYDYVLKDFGIVFVVGIGFNLVFVVIEVVYGYIVYLLVLFVDVGYNLSDVLGFVLVWGVIVLVKC